MKKTKGKILDTAHRLFNEYGVGSVTPRQIALEVGISHGNLNYHFNTKNEIIDQLHERLLNAAQNENARLLKEGLSITSLMESMKYGFKTIYAYRFFMIDLNHIMKINPKLHAHFIEVERLRNQMYQTAIEQAIHDKWMRPQEFEGEYDSLIERIRIFSDYWVASASIYDQEKNEAQIVQKHHQLFMDMFYPYLAESGREYYHALKTS